MTLLFIQRPQERCWVPCANPVACFPIPGPATRLVLGVGVGGGVEEEEGEEGYPSRLLWL